MTALNPKQLNESDIPRPATAATACVRRNSKAASADTTATGRHGPAQDGNAVEFVPHQHTGAL